MLSRYIAESMNQWQLDCWTFRPRGPLSTAHRTEELQSKLSGYIAKLTLV